MLMNERILKFDVLKATYHDGLVKAVGKILEEGIWQLYGQPYTDGRGNHFQAIVIYDK